MLKNSVNQYAWGRVQARRLFRVGQLLVLCRVARRSQFGVCLLGPAPALPGGVFSPCTLTAGGEKGQAPPDAVARTRQTDLQPRFPAPPEGTGGGGAGPRGASYYGSTPVEA